MITCHTRRVRTALPRLTTVAIAVLAVPSLSAAADVIYQTNTPFGSPFGFIGFDVSTDQSVAVRFTPAADFTLDSLGAWFMNNDFDGSFPPVTLSLRADDGRDIPGESIIETWTFNITAVGWDPQLEEVESKLHPVLEAGVSYWIVAQSTATPGLNPVWNWAANDSGFVSICNGNPCSWQVGGTGAVSACVVEGTPLPDCVADIAGGDNVVNIDDLLMVVGAWGDCPAPPEACPANIVVAGASGTVVDIDDLLAVIAAWGPCP